MADNKKKNFSCPKSTELQKKLFNYFFQICVYKYQAKSSEEQSRQQNAESLSADATKPVNTSRLKQLTDKFLKQDNEAEEKEVEKGEKFRQVLEKLDQLMKMDQEKNEMVDNNQSFDV